MSYQLIDEYQLMDEASTLPWKRELKQPPCSRRVFRRLMKDKKRNLQLRKFDLYPENDNIDVCTKRSTLIASPSVTCVECYSGSVPILQCSGVLIKSNSKHSIILTTAELVKCSTADVKIMVHLSDGRSFKGKVKAYDIYFDIAAIRIRPNMPLPVASLAHVNDSITVDPNHLHITEEKSPLCPRSTSFDLIPGEVVIALGRFPRKPYSIMAAPGLFSNDHCDYSCKEFFMASCRITSCGIGGPLINQNGEVIGICLRDDVSTGFLPINIASLWWENYKESRNTHQLRRQTRQPLLGMGVTNLYAAPLETLEVIIQKFPDVVEGVIVEDVIHGSSAESAGIKQDDVIIQFCRKPIKSVLELFESAWDKKGEDVEFVVVRASDDAPLHLTMALDEGTE